MQHDLDRLFERFRRDQDVSALGTVFDRTAPELANVARKLVPGREDAADLVQATFLTAIEHRERYAANGRLLPWLLGILVHHAHEHRRAARRVVDPARLHGREPPEPSTEAEAAERAELVQQALSRLSAGDRVLLEAYFREERPAFEIARASGRSSGAVRSHVQRGLARLRRFLPVGAALGGGFLFSGRRALAGARAEVLRRASERAGIPVAPFALPTFELASSKSGIVAVVLLVMSGGLAWLSIEKRASEPDPTEAMEAGSDEAALLPAVDARSTGKRVALRAAERESSSGTLEPATAHVSGRLVESDGRGIAGMRVALVELQPLELAALANDALEGTARDPGLVSAETMTDGNGRFTLPAAHARAAHFLAIDPGGPRGTLRRLERVLAPDRTSDAGEIVLASELELAGQVLAAPNRPLAGARVRCIAIPEQHRLFARLRADSALWRLETTGLKVIELPGWLADYEARLPVPTLRTDDDGRFAFPGLAAGAWTVIVDHPCFVTALVGPLELVPGSTALEPIALERGRSLRGRVLDAGGQPVAGAPVRAGRGPSVAASRVSRFGSLETRSRTDSEGRFELVSLPSKGPLLLASRAADRGPWTLAGVPEPLQDGFELRLAAEQEPGKEVIPGQAKSLRVRVVCGESGAPVSGATVALLSDANSGRSLTRGSSAGDGTLALFLSPEAERDARCWRLEHPAYARTLVPFASGQDAPELRLSRGGAVRLRVSGHEAPREWVLELISPALDLELERALPLREASVAGLAEIALLTPGEYRWELLEPAPADRLLEELDSGRRRRRSFLSGELTVEEGLTTEISIPFGERARIAGTVTIDDQPAVGLGAWAREETHGEAEEPWQSTTTDAAGAFALDVPAGYLLLMITEDIRPPEGLPVPDEDPTAVLHFESFELLPGSTRQVDLRWSSRPLRVRVTDGDGMPIFGACAKLRGEGSVGGSVGLTASDGWAALRALGPGEHELELEHPGFVAKEMKVQIPETSSAEPVLIALQRGTTCAGIVRLPAALRGTVTRAELRVERSRESREPRYDAGESLEFTGGEAPFRLEGMPTGRFRARFRPDGRNQSPSKEIEFEVPPCGIADLLLDFETMTTR